MIAIIAAHGPTMAQFTFCALTDAPNQAFPLDGYRQSGRYMVSFNRKKDKPAEFNKFIHKHDSPVGYWLPICLAEVPNDVLKAYIDAIKEVRKHDNRR